MKLYEIAKVLRSKNAGPFTLTLDVIFNSIPDFDKTASFPGFNEENIAFLYNTKAEKVKIHKFKRALAIKITMPRPVSSGAPGDLDVYGSQQHFPLGNMNIKI